MATTRSPDEDRQNESAAQVDSVERTRRADLWQAAADERERLADERDSVADEREWLADERDRLIEQREYELDRLEHALSQHGLDVREQLAAVREAVRRAEPGQGRAAEELARVRQSAARTEGRLLRSAAADERMAAASSLDSVVDSDERSWMLDRRDFVATERDRMADDRERSADRRDEAADMREDIADTRERAVDRREQVQQRDDATARRIGVLRLTPGATDTGVPSSRRTEERERRVRASRGREAAAQQRNSAAATWGPQAYGPRLVASFGELAGRLFEGDDPATAFAQVLDHAVAVLPDCAAAGLTVWRGPSMFDTLATSPAAATLDDLQFVAGEGPAWQAMQDGNPVLQQHLADDTDWPALTAAATSLGIGGMMSYALGAQGAGSAAALGAFTLYSRAPEAFSDEDRELAAILAAYLSVAVAAVQRNKDIERREASLHRALSTRDVIGQAKGILMERQGLSAPEAFDVLRRASQRLNLRLADIAEHLARTGTLPSAPTASDAEAP